MILLLYLDDMFITGGDELIVDTKRRISTELDMKEIGMMNYFLGMEVLKNA